MAENRRSSTALRSDRRYGISVYAEDEGGRVSAPSNVVSSRPGPLAARTGFVVLPAVQPARPPDGAPLADRESRAGHIRFVSTSSTSPDVCFVRWRSAPSGDGVPLGRHDEDGRPRPNGVYFARLAAGPQAARGAPRGAVVIPDRD